MPNTGHWVIVELVVRSVREGTGTGGKGDNVECFQQRVRGPKVGVDNQAEG